MARRIICSFLILWLADHVSADGGDDFANNLASDLGPIIALFGERVVMQFMSQAMGITDCILLAVAPIGAITTIVSAIRVAGPAWLRSFIGRARENLQAAEIDVMSSTSKEVCELWNGNSVVRCPGSADISQFICLVSKEIDTESPFNTMNIKYITLKDAEEYDADGEHKLLAKIPTAGPAYVRSCIKKRLFRLKTLDVEKNPEVQPITTSEAASSRTSDRESEPDIFVVVDNTDDTDETNHTNHDGTNKIAPNLLLNCHDRVGRMEIYLAAAFGVMLQLGALVYFGFITYHQPIQAQFLKGGKRAVDYAFPCAASGTVLLVFGLFICAWVVQKSTTETCYEAHNHRIFIVWLQKNHTVSDQVFKPFAICPTSERKYITLSRRNDRLAKQKIHTFLLGARKMIKQKIQNFLKHFLEQPREMIYEIFRWVKYGTEAEADSNEPKEAQGAKRKIANGQDNQSAGDETGENKQNWDWPLGLIAFFGALISFVGFISQFVGMRGLNWTASVVQLGITIVMTVLRVIVRRGLGNTPIRIRLKSKYELDWLALSFGDISKAHWAIFKKGGTSGGERHDKDSLKLSVCTGGKQAYASLKTVDDSNSQIFKDSKAHKTMEVRQQLGNLSKWTSPVGEEAARLSAAIETVAQTFLEQLPDKTAVWWTIPAVYGSQKEGEEEEEEEAIYIKLKKDGTKWIVNVEEIEAILSLWLYSIPSAKDSKTSERRCLRLYGPSHFRKQLLRDLNWWMPENIYKISTLTKDKIDEEKRSGCMAIGFTTETDSSNNAKIKDKIDEYLVLECQDEEERLLSKDLLFSFIRAVVKMSEFTISSASGQGHMNYNDMAGGWNQMRLKCDTITNLVRKLENVGFGTPSDIYFDLIVPLSLEQKLTNVKNVIDEVTKHAQEYERSCQWKKLVDTCSSLLDLAQEFDSEKESSGPLAIAVCLGFLDGLRQEAQLQQSEMRVEEELSQYLLILESKVDNFFENFTSFAWPRSDAADTKISARTFNMLIGSLLDKNKQLPDSFKVAPEHLRLIQTNDLKTLNLYIGELEKIDTFGWSPLHYAVNLPHLHDKRISLSEKGVPHGGLPQKDVPQKDVPQKVKAFNLRDHMGWTPLQYACLNGNEKAVDLLLSHGALIEIAGVDGVTPIHCAARGGSTNILRKLIERVNSKRQKFTRKSMAHVDRNERHPIHWAAIKGDVELVRLLKDDINLKDRFGWTCLHLAVIYKHENLCEYIAGDRETDLNMGDNDFRTPLHLAVESKSRTVLNVLLEARADVGAKAKDGSTPLHLAVEQDLIQMLLRKGADINAVDIEGRTPLYRAAAAGRTEAASSLISEGAKVSIAAKDGTAPLHMAVKQAKILQMLLEKGADINAVDIEGRTPLYLALKEGTIDVAHIYVIAAKENSGSMPLHIAAEYGSAEAITMLLPKYKPQINDHDAYGQTALLIAIYKKKWDIAEILLANFADPKADHRGGYTPLLGAVLGEENNIVEKLLEAKVDVNVADEDGYSPLHLAVSRDNHSIVKKLLEAHAKLDAVNELNGLTPLHIAVRSGFEEMVNTLLKGGASTGLLDHLDFSPLQYALYCGHLKIMFALVEHAKVHAHSNTSIDLRKRSNGGDTPLHTLCRWTHNVSDDDTMCAMLDKLLSLVPKDELNLKNDEGFTPLDLAVSLAGERYPDFINMLVENGAETGSDESERKLKVWGRSLPCKES
ncbi:hypothetical protein TrVFT333_010902 [Trichoderma virens FT-333]|nr:hypothetical protein TrVFT333_010902 [Trichoderma virens FT-333]